MGHGRRALLALGERLFRLDDVGLLKQAHLHGDGFQGGGRHGEGRHHLGVTVAGEHLGGQRVGGEPQLLANVLLHEGVDGRVSAHRAGDSASGGHSAGLLHAGEGALQSPGPAAELHAEGHGFGVNAVGTAHTQRILELEGATLAGFAEALDIVDDDVASLGDLVGQGRVAQVGRSHAVVHPAARLVGSLGNVGVDVARHASGERDDVVVRHFLDLIDLLHGEVGVIADPLRLLARDARLAELGLGLAGQHLDLLPNGELVLKLPDATHFRTSIATDHARFLSLAVCADASAACAFSFVNRVPEIARFVGGSRPSDRFRRAETPRHRQHTSVCAQISRIL